MAHFFYIHFAFPKNFRNVFEGHMATQFMESTGRPDMAGEGYGDEDLLLEVRGHLLRAVVHDQLAQDRLQGLRSPTSS